VTKISLGEENLVRQNIMPTNHFSRQFLAILS